MSHGGLGTLEFAATLNGDDANQIEEILRSFIRQVRKERNQACSKSGESIPQSELVSDVESSSTESDSEVHKNKHRKKKRKVEEWKLDAKSYNVPFVGTSLHKGDTGHVDIGSWPTGFLEAYLDKSPLATELLGSDFQRLLSKAGNRLQTVFVQSIAELVTCAVPIEKLDSVEDMSNMDDGFDMLNKGYNSVETSRLQIVSIIMKDHVKKFYDILNEHAASGSNQRLIIGVLECLQNLAKTSVSTAREIARGIDKFVKDATLKQLASCGALDKTKMEYVERDCDEEANKKQSKQKRMTLRVRKSFLNLASSLLEYGDQSVMFYITSPSGGGKDGALKSGVAYLGLRSALEEYKDLMKLLEMHPSCIVSKVTNDWSLAFCKFMCLIKLLICGRHGEQINANNQARFRREVILSNKAKVCNISYIRVTISSFLDH
jgi:hypothetical protein